MDYIPMTELEAVKTMLEVIGEQPVNSLNESGIPELEVAKSILHKGNREVQGWKLHCNTEHDYPLPVNADGEIVVPANTLNVDASAAGHDVSLRGQRLYDLKNHTYKFTSGISVSITFFLPFEELPQHVRSYIAIRSARQFQARYLGSESIHAFTEKDEIEALREFKRMEINNRDISMLDSPAVSRIALRPYI